MLQKWHRIVKRISKGVKKECCWLAWCTKNTYPSDTKPRASQWWTIKLSGDQPDSCLFNKKKSRRIVSQNVYFYGHFEPKYMNNYEYNYFQSTVQSFLHLFISQSITLCVTVCPLSSSSLSVLCWVQDVLHQCWGVSFLVAFLISLFLLCLSKLSFSSILLLPFPLLASSTHIAPLSTLLLLSTIYLTSTAP